MYLLGISSMLIFHTSFPRHLCLFYASLTVNSNMCFPHACQQHVLRCPSVFSTRPFHFSLSHTLSTRPDHTAFPHVLITRLYHMSFPPISSTFFPHVSFTRFHMPFHTSLPHISFTSLNHTSCPLVSTKRFFQMFSCSYTFNFTKCV